MENRIQGGFDILRREARGCRGKRRNWQTHNELMRQAEQHVTACGGDWERYASSFKRELAELMKL